MTNQHTFKAFIVDDDTKLLSMLKMNFELNGFNCLTSSNPKEAVNQATEFTPDIIISDLHMPEVDGFMLRERIMKDENLRDIPFIFLSSNNNESKMLQGYDLNVNDYLIKTESSAVLTKKVISIIKSNKRLKNRIKNQYKEEASKLDLVEHKNRLRFNDFEVNYSTIPFDDTPGGDFLEYLKLDEHRSVFVLADVMGKRWDAWFHSFPFKSYLRGAIMEKNSNSNDYDVASVLTSINSILVKDKALTSHSISLAICMINSATNQIQVAGAGCLPLLRIKPDGEIEEIAPIECAVGLSARSEYYSQTIQLECGDRVLAFTDGVIEAPDRYNKQLGFDGLKHFLKYYRSENDLAWIESLVRYYTKDKLTDDLSLLEIKIKK